MIAIETKYIKATFTEPQRMLATTCTGEILVINFDDSLTLHDNHGCAMAALQYKLRSRYPSEDNWKGATFGGYTDTGMAWVSA